MIKEKKEESKEDLLTVGEAAGLRGVTRTRIYQWINDGRLTKVIRYGRTLVDRKELFKIESLAGGRPKTKSSDE